MLRTPLALALIALASPGAAQANVQQSALPSCHRIYTWATFEHYARGVYGRQKVSQDARARVSLLRRCQISGHARQEARRLTRLLRKRYVVKRETVTSSPIPAYIVACESGGSYDAVNPSSGARGKYQIMPFHYSRGVCVGLDWSPAGQDACAARIWKSSGPGAWDCA